MNKFTLMFTWLYRKFNVFYLGLVLLIISIRPCLSLAPGKYTNDSQEFIDKNLNTHTVVNLTQSIYVEEQKYDNGFDIITNVSELEKDKILNNQYKIISQIVDKYDCINNDTDRKNFRDSNLEYWQNSLILNKCINYIKINFDTQNENLNQDIQTIQSYITTNRLELSKLKTRVENLESAKPLLQQKFSTTTKLNGEIDFAVLQAFGNNQAGGRDIDIITTFSNRLFLSFDTSFTGNDQLRIRLGSGNFYGYFNGNTGTDMTLYDFETGGDNKVDISNLFYRFPINQNGQIWLAAKGLDSYFFVKPFNPVGSASRWGGRNPLQRLSEGSGLAFNYQFNNTISMSMAYMFSSQNGANPLPQAGIFNGQFAALTQFNLQPTRNWGFGLTYLRYYSPQPENYPDITANTGSQIGKFPFGKNTATAANAYGVQTSYDISPQFTVSGWVGYTEAIAESSTQENEFKVFQGARSELWTWAVNLAFRDVAKQGNIFSFIFGMPPKLVSNDIAGRTDVDTTYHAEIFYRYQLGEHITITPALYVIFNPEHNNTNSSIWVTSVRSTFVF
ncbi:iron uptake porin [Nostoc parmelioides]|uniref:Iron uptake porin n=1 Tax=Nostoc parmelioides FACHB-3921 TaxID=2692909 RepID=A0ABR8BCA5_9NOSO|nr:iron uptake porin [Nostoc parmelioides]MBD2251481.1 iron uptake porin [Nostoc parmelioides FACHB-3921]